MNFTNCKKKLCELVEAFRVSTWIRDANTCVADKRIGDLESVQKEFMRIIS